MGCRALPVAAGCLLWQTQGSLQLAERDRAMPCASRFLTEGSQLHWAAMPASVSLCLLAMGRAPGWPGLLLFSSHSILPTLWDMMMWRQHLFPEAPLSPWLCGFQCSAIICKHIIRLLTARGPSCYALLTAESSQHRWGLGANKEQGRTFGR